MKRQEDNLILELGGVVVVAVVLWAAASVVVWGGIHPIDIVLKAAQTSLAALGAMAITHRVIVSLIHWWQHRQNQEEQDPVHATHGGMR